MPAAWFDRIAASSGEAPAAIPSVNVAMTVSPAPETSNTSCATVGMWNRLLPALAEQHAQFAERDEQDGRAEFVEQAFGGEHEILVGERIGAARFVRQVRQFKGFLAIGRDEREAGQVQMVNRLGIETQPDAARAAKRFEFIEQRLGDDAFAIIADNHGVRFREVLI